MGPRGCFRRTSILVAVVLLSWSSLPSALASQSPWVATDDYGYMGHNQDPFLWYNILGTGQRINMEDDSVTTVPIPFPFTFYGVIYNSIAINSNGLVCFTTSSNDLANTYIPNAFPPNTIIAPFWDDLDPSQIAGSMGVFWGTITVTTTPLQRAFVVTWYQVPFYSDPNEKGSFEIVLLEGSNEIHFNYLHMPPSARGTGGGATVGIESGYLGGQHGIQYSFDIPGTVEGLYGLTFCPPPGCSIPATPTLTLTPNFTPTPTPSPNLSGPFTVDITDLNTQGLPLNTIRVKVTDPNGTPIRGLSQADFNLTEERVDQYLLPPVTTADTQGIGLSVALGVDVSGSMSGQDVEDAGDSVINFVNNMTCTDRVALFSFEDDVVLEVPFTQDRGVIETAAKALGPLGATAMFDCMWDAITLTIPQPGAKAVMVFTDGGDNSSTHTQQQVINLAVVNQIPIYTIGLGGAVASAPLIAIANATGGEYFYAPSASQLAGIYDSIAQSIRGQYFLQYETSRPFPNGFQRNVSVCVGSVCDSGSYVAGGSCYLDHNELNPARDSLVSDATHIVAQKFVAPKLAYLESIHLFFESKGQSVTEIGIFSSNPAGDAPLTPIAFSADGPRLISCPGWQAFDFSSNALRVILGQGGEYWIIVRYIAGVPNSIRYSSPGLASGGIAYGDRNRSTFSWNTYDPAQALYFRALSCNLPPPVHTPTATPTATPTGPTSTPTLTPLFSFTPTPSGTPLPTSTVYTTSPPTPTPPPQILIGGYLSTYLGTTGGPITFWSWGINIPSSRQLGVYYQGNPTGVYLVRHGEEFTWGVSNLPGPLSETRVLLDLGLSGEVLWPYLLVTQP